MDGTGFLNAGGHRIEYEFIRHSPPDAPVMVFLHEGLGSIAMWKDFPRRCAQAAGCSALVYSRYGYGRSDVLAEPRPVTYLHAEALQALPELLDALHIDQPILFGHSDGASIAIIHAGGAARPVRGAILLAPHVFVEDLALEGIRAMQRFYEISDLRGKLVRYHDDPDSAFRGWSEAWLNPAFRPWNIEEYLPRIACPILAIQGENDEYGSMEQIDRIVRQAPRAQALKLNDCRHSPHRDQPEAIIRAVTQFVAQIAPSASPACA